MNDFLSHLTDAPIPNILILAGVLFLGIAAVGKVVGKIEPDKTGRILSGVLGLALLIAGFIFPRNKQPQTPGTPTNQTETTPGKPDQLPPQPHAAGFVSTVELTNPVAYFRLESASGASERGDATYTSSSGVSVSASGAPIGVSGNHCAVLNGVSGKITTTLAGGVGAAGSLMIWVKLASLPSTAGHPFYLVGESERNNDFDLQFEADDRLRFYTDRGDSIVFQPDVTSLVDHWHLIVATFDVYTQLRTLYWDGERVQTDARGGIPNKMALLSIGESPLWSGRFFDGSLDEVAVWNRALNSTDVTDIYHSASEASPK